LGHSPTGTTTPCPSLKFNNLMVLRHHLGHLGQLIGTSARSSRYLARCKPSARSEILRELRRSGVDTFRDTGSDTGCRSDATWTGSSPRSLGGVVGFGHGHFGSFNEKKGRRSDHLVVQRAAFNWPTVSRLVLGQRWIVTATGSSSANIASSNANGISFPCVICAGSGMTAVVSRCSPALLSRKSAV